MARQKWKRNWYIYVITFIVTSFIAGLTVSALWDTFFPEKAETVYSGGVTTSLPDASNNLTALVMLSEYKGGTPEHYSIINYRPGEEIIMCVPLKNETAMNLGSSTSALSEVYLQNGIAGVTYAIEATLGVKCDFYVKFDKSSFIDLIDETGTITMNIPYDISDDEGEVIFKSGSHSLDGEELFRYLYLQKATPDNDYKSVVVGSIEMAFFNSSLKNLSATVFQSLATKIINTTDTNFTLEDYRKRQQAILFTSESSLNPAQYYIPYGEYDANGLFVIAENSVATLKDRLGVEAEG